MSLRVPRALESQRGRCAHEEISLALVLLLKQRSPAALQNSSSQALPRALRAAGCAVAQ